MVGEHAEATHFEEDLKKFADNRILYRIHISEDVRCTEGRYITEYADARGTSKL